mgnify:CR=1 FL=1
MPQMMLTPQEISRRFNISYQTINYYTNLGLLVVRKKQRNSRLYDPREVRKAIDKVGEMKNQGYSLRLICNLMRNGQ